MAFVVEDGTGLANANSYASAATADAYFSDRGVSSWTGSSTIKEQALVRATDYIERMFGSRFIGYPFVDTQALSFPRVIAYETEMPVAVVRACCEYALRALSAKLMPDPKQDASGFPIRLKKTVVGPIETSLEFLSSSPDIQRDYPDGDLLLKPYLLDNGRVVRM